MANRFYTVLVVPEKTSQVRKLIIPAWMVKGAALVLAFCLLLGLVMFLNYWYVMSQIGENKQLKMENRRLRQQVQVFKNKMATVESTMERVKTFATRLKVITNIEDRGGLLQTLNNGNLPDASNPIGPESLPDGPLSPVLPSRSSSVHPNYIPAQGTTTAPLQSSLAPQPLDAAKELRAALEVTELADPEDIQLRKEYDQLDALFTEKNRETLYVEQMLQDLYELLADQKSFLAALPTRKPAVGYFTSGFGIRKSPYGGRVKMHEGLDIANRPGTPIKAPADGIVTFADTKSGYGQTLIIDHGYGVETWYAHTRKLHAKKGQKIRRGEVIAQLGNSGRSTGPHVHYEVRVHGTPVNPLSYILEN